MVGDKNIVVEKAVPHDWIMHTINEIIQRDGITGIYTMPSEKTKEEVEEIVKEVIDMKERKLNEALPFTTTRTTKSDKKMERRMKKGRRRVPKRK